MNFINTKNYLVFLAKISSLCFLTCDYVSVKKEEFSFDDFSFV